MSIQCYCGVCATFCLRIKWDLLASSFSYISLKLVHSIWPYLSSLSLLKSLWLTITLIDVQLARCFDLCISHTTSVKLFINVYFNFPGSVFGFSLDTWSEMYFETGFTSIPASPRLTIYCLGRVLFLTLTCFQLGSSWLVLSWHTFCTDIAWYCFARLIVPPVVVFQELQVIYFDLYS